MRPTLVTILIAIIFPLNAFAATKYWVGSGTGAMNVARNWSIYSGSGSTTTVPGSGDVMVFNSSDVTNAVMSASMTGASIEVRGGYTGMITMSASTVLSLNKLTIGSASATVRLGSGSRLLLRGSGNPLSGTGILDTFTNTPNTVEYTGPGHTNIPASTPVSSYHHLKIDPPGFSYAGAVAAGYNETFWRTGVIDTINGFAYFSGDIAGAGLITKYRLSDMVRVGVLTAGALGYTSTAVIDVAGGYAYFANLSSPARIYKIALSDFSLSSTLTLNAGENSVTQAGAIDTTNGYAYFGTCQSPSKIVKIRLSDFTRVGALTLDSGEDCPESLAIHDGYLYAPTSVAFATPVKIVKIRLSDFSRVSALTLNSDETGSVFGGTAVDTLNGFLYVGTYTTPGKVVKVDLSNFSRVGAVTFNSGENYASAATIDTTNGYLYFGTYTTPGKVVKIRLSDFSRTGAVTFPTNLDYPISGVIDVTKGFAYYGTYNPNPSWLVRVSLGSAAMNVGSSIVQSLSVSGSLMVGDGTNITPVRLRANLTVPSALTINAGGSLTLYGSSLTATTTTITNYGTITEGTGAILHPSSLPSYTASIGATIPLTLSDSDANIDGTTQDTITLTVGDETFTLTETSATSGIFSATLSTLSGPTVRGNAVIENNGACSYVDTLSYRDSQDSTDTSTATLTLTNSSCTVTETPGSGGGRRTPFTSGTTSSTSSSRSTQFFHDVPLSAWFFPFVSQLTQQGIVSGYNDAQGNPTGMYGPADLLTVGQILKLSLLTAHTSIPPSTSPDWTAPYIQAATRMHLSLASEDVHRPATRAEVIQTIMEALKEPLPSTTTAPFGDVPSSHVYAPAIARAHALGIIQGYTTPSGTPLNRFRPDDPINRAEVAKIIALVKEVVQ